jgi:hypothetical protein
MLKKYLKWGAIAFVAWFVIAKPASAANVVHGMIGGLESAAQSLGQFVQSVP